ncbi:unnamed protein product [Blepharisma stoltei]|uniref:Uncharacterized protein n=1 Tax=Blepharisma stoltei TaxID=1481888 RepID=A0AAU9KBB6_9CILI|nr:unnamed protein product [Blepharisma stoltei]
MKGELYSLKNKLAIAEEIIRRFKHDDESEILSELKEVKNSLKITREDTKLKDKIIKEYEAELSELGDALRTYENSQEQLQHERDYWKSLANCQNFPNNEYSELREKLREIEKDRIRAQEDAEHYKLKFGSLSEEFSSLKNQLETNDNNLKCQQAALKGEFGDIEYQLLKKNEQVKSSNKRFILLQRKLETVLDEKKELEEKNKILESERKKITEKWTNLVNRTKGEEKSRVKNKELEDELSFTKIELKSTQDKLKEAFIRIEDQQQQLASEQRSAAIFKEQINRLKVQNKVLTDEREILAKMNQELSIKVNDLEIDCTKFVESQRKSIRSASELSFSIDDSIKLQKKNTELEAELKKAYNDIKRFQSIIKQKDEALLKLEIKVSDYENEKRKTERYRPSISTDSLSGLIKNLVRETDQPLISAKDSPLFSNDPLNEKYERLLDKYQRLEEQNIWLEKQLSSTQSKLKAAKNDLNEHNSHLSTLEESKDKLADENENRFRPCSEVIKKYSLKTPIFTSSPNNSNTSSPVRKINKSRSNTPEEAVTTRYSSPFSISRLSVSSNKTPWKY